MLNPNQGEIQQRDIIFNSCIYDPGVYFKIIEKPAVLNLQSEIVQVIKRCIKQAAGLEVQRTRDQLVFQADNLHQFVIVFIIDGDSLIINPLLQGPGFAFLKAKAMGFLNHHELLGRFTGRS